MTQPSIGTNCCFPLNCRPVKSKCSWFCWQCSCRDNSHCVAFHGRTGSLLHIEWQQKLISMIENWIPMCKSFWPPIRLPVIMEGWLDAVTEVSDISTEADSSDSPRLLIVNDNFYMATSLRDNLTSFLLLAHKAVFQKARRRIIAPWRAMMMLLSSAHYSKVWRWRALFSSDAPSATSLAKGRRWYSWTRWIPPNWAKVWLPVSTVTMISCCGATNTSERSTGTSTYSNLHIRYWNYHLLCRKSSWSMCAATWTTVLYWISTLIWNGIQKSLYPLFPVERVVLSSTGYLYLSRCTTSIYCLGGDQSETSEHSLEALQHQLIRNLRNWKKFSRFCPTKWTDLRSN